MRSVARNTAARGHCMASVVLGFGLIFGVFFVVGIHGSSGGARFPKLLFSRINNTGFVGKLPTTDEDDDGSTTNRINGGTCSKDNIAIFQGPTTPLPNGIPTYTVQIQNVCVWGCSVSNIHLSCGWFSSARLINPRVFRRVCYDDCLVNDGEALAPGQSLSFQYANSFSYPLSVSSVTCN